MSETQQPKDLTAQLAELVRQTYHDQHWQKCACDLVDGGPCRYPKPATLVAYEQAQQQERAIAAGWCADGAHEWQPATTDQRRQVCAKCPTWQWRHDGELPNPLCSCPTCNDLRADGAGDFPEPNEALKAALRRDLNAYVLFSQPTPRDTGDTEVLRVYASEAAAEAACALCLEVDKTRSYRVHAVPRVE